MISERKRIAEELRSEGLGKRAEIEGRKDRELDKIESEAYRKAQEFMGKADAEATAIYANAYNRDSELFTFTRTLEAYRNTLDKKVTLFLSSEGEFLELLND
jgi:membrane protease subunit HflC